jgi:hypothetical protein
MTQVQNKLTVHQDYINQLLEQLTISYQNTKLERQKINQQFSPEQDFTPLEELELLTVNIRGYASQIAATGIVKSNNQTISELQQLSVFNNHTIVQLYDQARLYYPHLQSYISLLDYLRLLVLEWITKSSPKQFT